MKQGRHLEENLNSEGSEALTGEAMSAPYLEEFKARLYGAQSNLI